MTKRAKQKCGEVTRVKPHIRAIADMVVALGGAVDKIVITKHCHVYFTLDGRAGRLLIAGTPKSCEDQYNYARQQLQRHRRAG